MRTYRLEITLAEDGALQLDSLPFQKGDTVEVILLEREEESASNQANPLKESVLRYDDPTKELRI